MIKGINFLCDLFVIIVQISFGISIIPYVIYDKINPFSYALLIQATLNFCILIFRFKGRIISFKRVFNFRPIIFFFLLLFLQLCSGFANLDNSSIGISIILILNFFVFYAYLNNLFIAYWRKYKSFSLAFLKLNSFYINFAFFNVVIVIISALFQLIGLLKPFSNKIDDLFTQLLVSNTAAGTHYFMPGWMSIQTMHSRLGLMWGNLMGWTHEPHVFSYLVFPSLFFFLDHFKSRKKIYFLFTMLFLIAGVLSFSVTSFFVISVIIIIKLLADKKYFLMFAVLLIGIGLIIFNYEIGIIKNITNYSLVKVTSNTTSMDYSANHIKDIIISTSIFGKGVLLINRGTNGTGGALTAIFYLLFYASFIVEAFKLIFSKNKQSSYIGMGFLYFILHSFKLSSSVFAMPYTFYFLIVMAFYKRYNPNMTSKLKSSVKYQLT